MLIIDKNPLSVLVKKKELENDLIELDAIGNSVIPYPKKYQDNIIMQTQWVKVIRYRDSIRETSFVWYDSTMFK